MWSVALKLRARLSAADGSDTSHVFIDNAILIGKWYIIDQTQGQGRPPVCSVSVSINANPRANFGPLNHEILFDVDWWSPCAFSAHVCVVHCIMHDQYIAPRHCAFCAFSIVCA